MVDCVGNFSAKDAKHILTNKGRVALVVADLYQIIGSLFDKKIHVGTAFERAEDIAYLLELLEKGEIKTVIDKTYKIEDIVVAHTHVDSGRKVGNVIVTLD